MNFKRIEKLQKEYGVDSLQRGINTGQVWLFEGSAGRFAQDMLKWGVVMLPKFRTRDYYGNTIPARTDLKDGTKGTYQNCVFFWAAVESGDIEKEEFLLDTF